jgi:hypothetical protein
MPAVRSFTRGQWEALGRRLDALPEKAKDEQHLKVGDGVKSIRTQIGAAREKGYTLSELIEQAAQEGIDVNLNSLRYAMRRAEEKGRFRRESKEVGQGQVARPARARKPAQANATGDIPLRAGSQRKGDGGMTRPGLTPLRHKVSRSIFPISRIGLPTNCAASACQYARRQRRCISGSGRNCCAGAPYSVRCLPG